MIFKVTTSKMKCHFCKNSLKGEEGFIHIICEPDKGWFSGISDIRICWKCINNYFQVWTEDRKTREEKYNKLMKEAVFRKLK